MDGVQIVGVIGLAVVLVVVAALALLRGRYDGRMHTAVRPGLAADPLAVLAKTARGSAADLGPSLADAGISLPADQVTVVQFSGEFCAVCPQARTLVERVLLDHPEFAHVEVDVADHLEAVRALDIRRTPTVLIVDRRGRALHRVSGMPRESELRHALADLVDHR